MASEITLSTGRKVKSIEDKTNRDIEINKILLNNNEALLLNLNKGAMTIHIYTKDEKQCHYTNNKNVPIDYSNNRIFVVEDKSIIREIVDKINLGQSNKIGKVSYCIWCGQGRADLIFP